MAEELELELEDSNINKTEERIKNLSTKVRDTASERDEAKAKADTEAQARLAAEKERDFFKNLSTLTGKFPAASEFSNDIWDKVKAGYSEEDAAVAVLNAKGKLMPQTIESAPLESAGGGSAVVNLPNGEPSLETMTREEKRQALMDIEKEGELTKILRRGFGG